MWLDNLRISNKMLLAVVVSVVGFAVVSTVALFNLKQELMNGRQQQVQAVVEAASAAVNAYYAEQTAGRLTEDEAKARAIADIKAMRYGHNDYLWINDMVPHMIMHPIKPELNGKELSGLKDPAGSYFFIAMVDVVRKGGSGFVSYIWPKPGFDQPVRKVSFVKGFAPWGWIIGTGVYLDDVDQVFLSNLISVGGIIAVVVLLVLVLSYLITTRTARPIEYLNQQMASIAGGDLQISVEGIVRRDEIGSMAKAVDVFRLNAIENRRLQAAQHEAEQQAILQRRQEMMAMADALEQRVHGVVVSINSSARELHGAASNLSANAEQTQRQSFAVSEATEQANANVATVASASVELSASIQEISRQVSSAADVAHTASREAQAATGRIAGLESAVQSIGEVVSLINDIASQTNLLALNATIESARAGDAGKGFAVVAHEVKNLAGQTGRATEDIARQIGAIQEETRTAVAAIEAIAGTIDQINELSSMISESVVEQGAATNEIARNVEHASDGTRQVADNITGVSMAANETGAMAAQVFNSAETLVHEAADLEHQVESFLKELRAS